MDRRAAGLEVALELRAAGADLVGALEGVHPLDEGALRGRRERLGGRLGRRRHGRRVLHRSGGAIKRERANSPGPQAEVKPACQEAVTVTAVCRTFLWAGRLRILRRAVEGASSSAEPRSGQLVGDSRRRRAGRGSSRCRRATRSAPARSEVARVAAALDPAHADDRDLDPRGDLARPGRARSRGPPARRRRRCRRRATARRCVGCSAMPRSVLISETASAPRASAAAATAAGVGRSSA